MPNFRSTNPRELRSERAALIDEMDALLKSSTGELSPTERRRYDAMERDVEYLGNEILRLERRMDMSGPQISRLMDQQARAAIAYIRTGNRGPLQDVGIFNQDDEYPMELTIPRCELRATDEIMNVAASADGGAAVPTGFAGMIAARRNALRISDRLGVRPVPGKGTTVNFPYENADPNEFATTSEQVDALSNTYERDRPTLGNKAFTLIKKTKKLVLTEELLDDEDANLISFIADHIGRAIALTHNAMLLTEIASSGTALKTFASASAIAAGELEDLVYNDTLGYYLDDGGSIGWVMRPTSFGAIKTLTGNPRLYEEQAIGSARRQLLEYPVVYSNSATAIGASAKSLYFGNWFYVGMREAPALRFIRDPFSTDGVVNLKYSFRACYGVLVAGAIGYAAHPSS